MRESGGWEIWEMAPLTSLGKCLIKRMFPIETFDLFSQGRNVLRRNCNSVNLF